jgi:hypothetical protein
VNAREWDLETQMVSSWVKEISFLILLSLYTPIFWGTLVVGLVFARRTRALWKVTLFCFFLSLALYHVILGNQSGFLSFDFDIQLLLAFTTTTITIMAVWLVRTISNKLGWKWNTNGADEE